MNEQNLLVFPVNVDASVPFIRNAKSLGFTIIGASSLDHPLQEGLVDDYVRLPFITDSLFDDQFLAAINEYRISRVYAPHHGVWWHLKSLLERQPDARFALCEPHPFEANWEAFQQSLLWAQSAVGDTLCEALQWAVPTPAPELNTTAYAALHRGFLRVPGETDEDKLRALCSIARVAPKGEIVEIGSLYGRSAYALGWLAKRYAIGATICVDPWNAADLTDQGPAARILADEPKSIDYEKIFQSFCATAAELNGTSYIRNPSARAVEDYRQAIAARALHTPQLPPVPVSGKVSLLHIDGNHRYDHVINDIKHWSPYLADGGWLLLDDYVWAFGDGPRRAGDELLASGAFDCGFVASDTLFLRKAPVATAQ